MIWLAIAIPWIALFFVSLYEEKVNFNMYPSKVLGVTLLVQILVALGYGLGKYA